MRGELGRGVAARWDKGWEWRGEKRSREDGGEARREHRARGWESERGEEGLGAAFISWESDWSPVGPFGLKWTWFA